MAPSVVRVRLSGYTFLSIVAVLGLLTAYIAAAPRFDLPGARDFADLLHGNLGLSPFGGGALGMLAAGLALSGLAVLGLIKPSSQLVYHRAAGTLAYSVLWRVVSRGRVDEDGPRLAVSSEAKSYRLEHSRGTLAWHCVHVSGLDKTVYETSNHDAAIARARWIAARLGGTFTA